MGGYSDIFRYPFDFIEARVSEAWPTSTAQKMLQCVSNYIPISISHEMKKLFVITFAVTLFAFGVTMGH